MLFSIKGFDDNGKNGLDRQFSKSEQVLTGNWMEFTIHGRHYREKKNPTPEGDGGNYFYVDPTLGCQIVVQTRLFFWEELIRTYTFIDFEDFSYLHVFSVLHVYKSRLFFWEEKSSLHKLIRTYTFIDFEDFSYLHGYSGLHLYLAP